MSIRTLLFFSILPLCAQASQPEPLRIGVSVLPLETLVSEIGGEQVEVHSLQQEGDSCSVFEPRPSSVTWLAGAELFFRTGVGYETAILSKVERQYKGLKVLDLRDALGTECLLDHDHHDHDHHSHGPAQDPHIWLDPVYLAELGEWIAHYLGESRPGSSEYFDARAEAFAERMKNLDREIREILEPHRDRAFFIYHPALSYFAQRYQLKQVAIEESGREPSVSQLHALVGKARADNVRSIFVQPQESRRQADLVAAATGGKVIEIDPMAVDLEKNLLRIAHALADSFGKE